MFKRVLVVAIVLVTVLSLVSTRNVSLAQAKVDCGTTDSVTLAMSAGSVGNEFDTVQAIAKDYMAACPNVTVKAVAHPASSTDILAQYQQIFNAKSSEMDIVQMDVIWPGLLAEHLVDLNQYVSKDFVAGFVQSNITNNTVKGQLVALPWFAGSGMLYFRTDLLKKYSVAVPQTWDDLYTAAKKIQDGERAAGNKDFWGFVYQGKAYEGLTCDALEWQASVGGGTILGTDGTIQVNNPETIGIFDKMAKWVGDIVPQGVTTFQEEDARAVWQAGNAAFMRNWGYAYPLGQAKDDKGNLPVIAGQFDVAPLPGAKAGMSAATLGGWELGVSKYSKNIKAAVALVVYFTGYDAQVKYILARGEAPTFLQVYDNDQIKTQLPYLKADVIKAAVARPSTVSGDKYAKVSELYYTAVNDILTGKSDATSALEKLELDLADQGFALPKK
jgi:trehalose/maltose transport system substrate-binding protein